MSPVFVEPWAAAVVQYPGKHIKNLSTIFQVLQTVLNSSAATISATPIFSLHTLAGVHEKCPLK